MSKKMRSIMTTFVAFVGIGKAGCKLANEFRALGYSAYFINSSAKDLELIDAPKNMKYHIPFAQGTNGDRTLAKQYCKEYFDLILNNIKSKLGNFTHIIFCFSSGGGTGSGISPILVNNMIKKTEDIDFGVICALPSKNEHPKAKYNSYECSKELQMIQDLKNIYLINNELTNFQNTSTNLDMINQLFAMRFDNTMLLVDIDDTGNVDETEMRAALSIGGCCTFADIIQSKEGEVSLEIEDMMLPLGKGCGFILYSMMEDTKFKNLQEAVHEKFGMPPVYKQGKGVDNFITVFGLPFPKQYINEMGASYSQDVETIQNIEEEDIDLMDIKYVDPIAQKRKHATLAVKTQQLLDEFEEF